MSITYQQYSYQLSAISHTAVSRTTNDRTLYNLPGKLRHSELSLYHTSYLHVSWTSLPRFAH